MALTVTRRNQADTALTTVNDALRSRQSGILGARGRYHQLRRGAWDRWQEFEPDAATIARVWVDEYLSGETRPPAPGYSIVAAITVAPGEVWQRIVHVSGPETWRDSGGWIRLPAAGE